MKKIPKIDRTRNFFSSLNRILKIEYKIIYKSFYSPEIYKNSRINFNIRLRTLNIRFFLNNHIHHFLFWRSLERTSSISFENAVNLSIRSFFNSAQIHPWLRPINWCFPQHNLVHIILEIVFVYFLFNGRVLNIPGPVSRQKNQIREVCRVAHQF